MSVSKDPVRGTYYVQCWYKDWTGKRCKKTKRGFKTKKAANAWEVDFLRQMEGTPDMTLNAFYGLYCKDMDKKLRNTTKLNKANMIESKILPYLGEKKLAESKIALDENDLKLAEAKKALDAGYANYAAGQSRLAAGAAKLAAGAAQLAVFEGGQQQIADALDLVIGTETYRNAEGKAQVKSIASRLGKDFNYWRLDENGEIVVLNDEPVVDLEKAALVVQAGRDFVDDTTEVVTAEIITRVILTIVAALACLAGVAAAILGLCAVSGASATLGVIAFALSLGGIIAINLFGGNEYPMSRIVGSEVTGLVLLTMAAVAVAAVINTVMAFICNDDAQKPAETPEAPAQAEQSEPVAVN